MNDAIAHRGPDAEGFYHSGGMALGHRRLSILDLSELGTQPMHWKDLYTITYNGEVYNYLEIREELIALGYSFRSETDTEVMLAAYDCWGEECVSRFNGMWAFALHDHRRNVLFCSRDRFGIKPFYYRETTAVFVFGSEIRQLTLNQKHPVANMKILLDYLITGLEDCTSETFFEGIMKLPAGHNLVYDLERHTHQIRPFYEVQFDKTTGKLSEMESVALYGERLTNSVKLRLRSDVKVGTCLSGGLDSSTVAALAAKLYTGEGKFQAIHAKSEELKTDESSYAQRVADHTGIELTIVEPDYNDFAAEIDTIIETQEEPFGSPSVAMQYFVLKKAREINCIVMLDGQGGDETLLGYERYYPAMIRTLPAYRKWKALRESYRNSKLTMKQTIAFMFYFGNYRVRLSRVKQRAQFLKKEYLHNFHSPSLEQLAASYADIRLLQKQEIKSTQLPHLLRYEDKNSMRHAVETRLPFIDYRVVETALSTNNAFKIKDGWTKYLLRKVISPLLPEEIVWRKNKLGFNAPEDIWLQKHLPVMETAIRESVILNELIDWNRFHIHALDLRMQWRLFNIAKWEQVCNIVTDKK